MARWTGSMRTALVLAWSAACGGSTPPPPEPTLRPLSDAVVRDTVMPLLPAGAVLARPAVLGDVGLQEAVPIVVWTDPSRTFSAAVVQDGVLVALPELHGAGDAPRAVAAVMLVQADSDAAGELVVLLDRSDARPTQDLTNVRQTLEAVVIDHQNGVFVRRADLEEAVAGLREPNELRAVLTPR